MPSERKDSPAGLQVPEHRRLNVRQQLVPTLRPGDVVVMDSLARHERPGVRQAIESVGARLLLLPPYSPDLKPIDQAFAKLKVLLRKVGERTVEELQRLLGRLLDRFTPWECCNSISGGRHVVCRPESSTGKVAPPPVPGPRDAFRSAKSAMECIGALEGSPSKSHQLPAPCLERTKGMTLAGLAVVGCWRSLESSLTRWNR